jgi:hypothetical protein
MHSFFSNYEILLLQVKEKLGDTFLARDSVEEKETRSLVLL